MKDLYKFFVDTANFWFQPESFDNKYIIYYMSEPTVPWENPLTPHINRALTRKLVIPTTPYLDTTYWAWFILKHSHLRRKIRLYLGKFLFMPHLKCTRLARDQSEDNFSRCIRSNPRLLTWGVTFRNIDYNIMVRGSQGITLGDRDTKKVVNTFSMQNIVEKSYLTTYHILKNARV